MEPVPCIILLLSRSARYGQWHKDKEKGAGGAAAVKTVLLVIIILFIIIKYSLYVIIIRCLV